MKRALLRPRRRDLIGLLVGMALLPAMGLSWIGRPAHSEIAAADAEATVNDLATQIWALFGQAGLGDRERIDALTALLVDKTDVALLSRLALGRYWQQLDEEQQARYQKLFRDVVMRNFASRLNQQASNAQGEFEDRFTIASSAPVGERDVLVRSRVKPVSGDTVAVDWRLREGDGGPVIIDVIIEGVSLLVTQRSEFAAVIERSDMEGLLAELQARAGSTSS